MTNQNSFRIIGAAVLDQGGSFVDGLTVEVEGGVVTWVGAERPSDLATVAMHGHWLMPGVVDAHSHVFWNAFHAADRDAHPLTYNAYEAIGSLQATLHAGVTSVRDAGGADAGVRDAIDAGLVAGPRLAVSETILGRVEGHDQRLRQRVTEVLDRGADWIKLAATGGVTAPEGSDLESHFTLAEFRAAVDTASGRGKRVMVHAWGGDAIDFAIEAGVGSIEHGMFLTDDQAHAAAATGITLVPTLTIYREVGAIAASGALPPFVAERAQRVVEQHPLAIQRARDAGMPIALGSDFGTPDQHGRNLAEITALVDAGLSTEQALLAATRNGAALMGDSRNSTLAPGQPFDAIALGADPSDPRVFADPATVTHVWKEGRAVRTPSDPAPGRTAV